MTRSQGGQANRTGNVLENVVIGTLSTHGLEVVQFKDYERRPLIYGQELLLRNVPYRTLYGGKGRTEFLIRSARYQLCTRVECKWQQSAGSVDEKLPHAYLSCVEAIDEDDVIIMIGGNGFRPEAVNWLRQVANERRYVPANKCNKRVRVMTTDEFLTWCNNTFR
ncbi:MAG: PD-(D/E)XK nuclease superfamily protein [Gammaproteobacteria bacterium]